jgi:hypothetical protein
MSLPGDKEFKVKYKVKVAAGVSGDKSFGGKFSYVVDNVKQSVDIAPSTIKIEGPEAAVAITPNTTTDNTAANNTNTSDNTTTTTPVTTPANEPSAITAVRKAPESATGDFTVDITISKGNVTGFAKLLETLPAGFTATQGETQGASFSFSEGKVKFVWVSMPTVPEFKISYKAVAPAGTTGNQTIEGVFSYIENDETKKHTIPASTVSFGGAMADNTTTPVKTADNINTTDNTATKNTTETATNNTNNTDSNTNNNTTNTNTNTAATNNNNQDNTTTDNSAKTLSATNIPTPQGNVNYKVQIAALRNAVDASKLASRFNINQKVEMEMAQGLTKYIVGSHPEYKSARDARENIKSKGVNDAFVTAYNSGKRITVQEALMITSQKWYR